MFFVLIYHYNGVSVAWLFLIIYFITISLVSVWLYYEYTKIKPLYDIVNKGITGVNNDIVIFKGKWDKLGLSILNPPESFTKATDLLIADTAGNCL